MGVNGLCVIIGLGLLLTLPSSAKSPRLRGALLHNAGWATALLIAGSGLVQYDEISLTAILIIVASIVAFNLAVAIGYGKHKPCSTLSAVEADAAAKEIAPKALVTKALYILLLAAFAVGIAIYLYRMAGLFGLHTLFTDPSSIRSSRDIKYLEEFPIYGKILVYLGPLCFVLTVFPWLVEGASSTRRPTRYALAGLILLMQAVLLQRTNIFVCLLWAAGIGILRVRWDSHAIKLPVRRFLALAILAVVIFQGLAVALGKTGTENSAITSTVGSQLAGSQATGVLVYASSGVLGFDKLVRSENVNWPPSNSRSTVYGDFNPPTNGLATLAAVTSRLPIEPNWQEVSPFVLTPVPTNVYTWLEPWYRDFQTWGALFAVGVLGVLLGQVGRRALGSPEALLFAGLLLGFSGLAGFNNRYGSTMSLILYATVISLGRLRSSRHAKMARRLIASPAGTSGMPDQFGHRALFEK